MADIAIPQTRAGADDQKAVAVWLLVVCGAVFAMVVLGGVTRLTDSGLSIVDWRPITGVLPPLGEAAWREAFARYQEFPEYQKINQGMTLSEFKSIFWFEFAHRLVGRLLGFIFFVPFLWFVVTRRVNRVLAPKLIAMFVLGGLQGLLGWAMVKSGLVDRPDVSHLRLTAHLGLAILIYGYMFWVALGLLTPATGTLRPGEEKLAFLARGLVPWIFFVILTGGLVAGLDAGFVYNTFPLMDGDFVPAGFLSQAPWPTNFLDNIATVQFDHRWLAIFTAALIAALWVLARRAGLKGRPALALNLLLGAVGGQVALGISTLVLVVPVPLAAAHQAGALLLLTAAIFAAHTLRVPAAARVHGLVP